MLKQIPNLFTLLNLLFGCAAIICILQTGETIVVMDEGSFVPQLPEKIWWGALLLYAAAFVDFLDGFVARLFKATSAMGAQLDSLADVVSFGVAPGLIIYQLLRISTSAQENALDASLWILAPASLVPAAAAWRLARFNIESSSTGNFSGLPSPAAGLFIAALPLIVFYNYFNVAQIIVNKWTLYAIIMVISYLMISRFSFMALKFTGGSLKDHLPKIILAIIAVIAALLLGWLAVPVIFIVYFIFSLISKKESK